MKPLAFVIGLVCRNSKENVLILLNYCTSYSQDRNISLKSTEAKCKQYSEKFISFLD